jgi:hypothetical protein
MGRFCGMRTHGLGKDRCRPYLKDQLVLPALAPSACWDGARGHQTCEVERATACQEVTVVRGLLQDEVGERCGAVLKQRHLNTLHTAVGRGFALHPTTWVAWEGKLEPSHCILVTQVISICLTLRHPQRADPDVVVPSHRSLWTASKGWEYLLTGVVSLCS